MSRTPRATDQAGLLLGGLEPGARVGEYVIEAQLPTHGTGHLYAATHALLPRRATLKILPAAISGMRERAMELLREACIVDAVEHPGVPRLYESGMLADRRPWVAIERIEGTSLATMLDLWTLPLPTALAMLRDVAEILVHIHAHGVVHCNVVPSAIVIPARARRFPLCLVDWSAARAQDSTRPAPLAPARECLGYLAPEQLHGDTVTDRADIFSLGMIARELRGDHTDVPPMLLALLERMVDRDPAQRPSITDVHAGLQFLASSERGAYDVPALETSAEVPTAPRKHLITSEQTEAVAGEIEAQ